MFRTSSGCWWNSSAARFAWNNSFWNYALPSLSGKEKEGRVPPKTMHISRWLPSALMLLLLATGCSALPFLNPQTAFPTKPASSPTVEAVESPEVYSTPTSPESQVLVIWVPPQFDANKPGASGRLLRERLDAFAAAHPGVTVEVRVKQLRGPGSLLESLAATSAAAPLRLPSLIALPRQDLEVAALKGLIFPVDGVTTVLQEEDWYPYARQSASVQNSNFGLPFAGDALLLMQRPAKTGGAIQSWYSISSTGLPLAFPAADPQALLTLNLYLSVGGKIQDEEGRPMLEQKPLIRVLEMLAAGAGSGVYPYWLMQYQTYEQVKDTYREQRVPWAVAWSADFFANPSFDTSPAPLPRLGETEINLANAWIWCIPEPEPERHILSGQLADFLVDSEFMGAWTAATGYLPTRPNALQAWPNQSFRETAGQIADFAISLPSYDLMGSLGPVLEEATTTVLKLQTTPAQAAANAIKQLQLP